MCPLYRGSTVYIHLGEVGQGGGERGGKSVAEVVHGEKKMKTMVGHTIKEVDAAW